MKGYPAEIKQWWDNLRPFNWGAASDDTAATTGHRRNCKTSARDAVPDVLHLARRPRRDHQEAGRDSAAEIWRPHAVRRHHRRRRPRQERSASHLHARRGTENRCRESRHHGHAEIHHPAHRARPPREAKRRHAPDPLHSLSCRESHFRQAGLQQGYDTWCPGNTFTDVIVADWVVRNQPGYKQKYNILTCYTPMSEDDRGYLLTEPSTRKIAAQRAAAISRSFSRDRMSIRSKCTSTAADILFICPRPASTPRFSLWCAQPMDRVFFANTDSEGPESTTSQAIAGGAARGERS